MMTGTTIVPETGPSGDGAAQGTDEHLKSKPI